MSYGILLVHGYNGSPEDLTPLHEALSAEFKDVCVTSLKLPGHGQGTSPSFDLDLFAENIRRVVDEYKKSNKKTILIGHSTGGIFLLHFCKKYGFEPFLVVLAAVPKKIDGSYFERWKQHTAGRAELPFTDIAKMVLSIKSVGTATFSNSFRVMILHGDCDELVPIQEAFSWKKECFTHSQIEVIPWAGHHLFTGSNNKKAVETVIKFISDSIRTKELQCSEFNRLLDAEPEMKKFLSTSPDSACHIAESPSAYSFAGRGRNLSARTSVEPVFANIEITTKCNMNCRFCARGRVEKKSKDMSLQTYKQVLNALKHAYRITLVGLGEPLLNPDVVDIVRETSRQNRRVGIVTNAMNLDKKLSVDLLDAGLNSIAFSIDAPDQPLADNLRTGSDLERIIENIERFMSVADKDRVSAAIFCALSEYNICRFENVIDIAVDLGVHVIMVSDLNFQINADHSLCKTSSSEKITSIKKAVKYAFSRNLPILSVRALEEFGLYKRYGDFILTRPEMLFRRPEKLANCFSPWQCMPVDVEGNMTVCDCQPTRVAGNLLLEPIDKIWNGEIMMEQRRRMLTDAPEACKICPRF